MDRNALRRQLEARDVSEKPFFLITIDTEGDDLWAAPAVVETENAAYLPRFQSLCERYDFKPTWLTNYEMASSAVFVEFAREALARGAAEVGTHLHAWNSPPLVPLGDGTGGPAPYLTEFPDAVVKAKLIFMTDLLEETFGIKMCSHRGGRWALDEHCAKILAELDYLVDTTVTPGWSWRQHPGGYAPGRDYTKFSSLPYFIDTDDISRAGDSRLLEAPMTILPPRFEALHHFLPKGGIAGRITHRLLPQPWLRPNGRNLSQMQRVLDCCREEQRPYAMFMLHSSELMPGGSPTFKTERSIEQLYDSLEALFESAQAPYRGGTLSEFYSAYTRDHGSPPSTPCASSI